jgi:hypothetical protein
MLTIKTERKIDMTYLEGMIVKNRARKLTEEDLVKLRNDIQEEVLLSSYVYEKILSHIREGGEELGNWK